MGTRTTIETINGIHKSEPRRGCKRTKKELTKKYCGDGDGKEKEESRVEKSFFIQLLLGYYETILAQPPKLANNSFGWRRIDTAGFHLKVKVEQNCFLVVN